MVKRFLLILVFGTVFLFGCHKNAGSDETVPQNTGNGPAVENNQTGGMMTDAPDFTLNDINGKVVKLSDFKGKYVIVDFWATWCGPCRRGIPDLIELQNKYKNNLQVIGISVDQEDTRGDVVPFYNNFKINYPVVYASEGVVNMYGGIQAIPTSFVIDKSGKILNKYVGLVPSSEYEQYFK